MKATTSDLKTKVERLIYLHKKQTFTCIDLLNDKENLLKQLEEQKNTINKLAEQNKILKLANSFFEKSENSADVKIKINELVREIDKSIALLNK